MTALEQEEVIINTLLLVNKTDSGIRMSLDDWNHFVDNIESKMIDGQLLECDVKHRFTDDMYIREIYMEKGQMVISNIHNTTHPYTILEGVVDVRTHEGIERLKAPYFGVTTPGTRRILSMVTDVRWITFHPTKMKNVQLIMDSILKKRTNPLLTEIQLLKLESQKQQTNLLH